MVNLQKHAKLNLQGWIYSILLLFLFSTQALATVINVPSDQPTIQAGIDASSDGDTVLVQPGTYVENINFNGKNIVLGSLFLTTSDTSYISQTVIDGNQNGTVVTFSSGEAENSNLIGFTVTNGTGSAFNSGGGGIFVYNSSPRIENIIITGNHAYWGGGLYLVNASPTITNSYIFSNYATDMGGGIFIDNADPIIVNTIVYNNDPSGIYVGFWSGGYRDNETKVINCTLLGPNSLNLNYPTGESSLIGTVNIINSIIWDNGLTNIINGVIDSVIIYYSNIAGGWEGPGNIGNINSDPLFVDATNSDYRLSDYSPCIGSGIDSFQIEGTWYYAPTTDIDGNPRPNPPGSNPDMGAYENSRAEPLQAIISTNPPQNALNVPQDTDILVIFGVDINPATINANTFVVHASQTGLRSGTYSYDSGTKTASFNPDIDFKVGEVVTVTLTTGIQDTDGNPLPNPYTWSFTIEVFGGSGDYENVGNMTVGGTPFSVTTGDFDGDGDLDLATVNETNTVSILKNNGTGSFTESSTIGVEGGAEFLTTSDLDGDGDLDLAVANKGEGTVSVLTNDGYGNFTHTSKPSIGLP